MILPINWKEPFRKDTRVHLFRLHLLIGSTLKSALCEIDLPSFLSALCEINSLLTPYPEIGICWLHPCPPIVISDSINSISHRQLAILWIVDCNSAHLILSSRTGNPKTAIIHPQSSRTMIHSRPRTEALQSSCPFVLICHFLSCIEEISHSPPLYAFIVHSFTFHFCTVASNCSFFWVFVDRLVLWPLNSCVLLLADLLIPLHWYFYFACS